MDAECKRRGYSKMRFETSLAMGQGEESREESICIIESLMKLNRNGKRTR